MLTALKYRMRWHWADFLETQVGRFLRVCVWAIAYRYYAWAVKRTSDPGKRHILIKGAARAYGNMGTAVLALRKPRHEGPVKAPTPARAKARDVVETWREEDDEAPTNPRLELPAPVTDLRKWKPTSAKRRKKQAGAYDVVAAFIFACFVCILVLVFAVALGGR